MSLSRHACQLLSLLLVASGIAACGPVFDPDTQGYLDGHVVSDECDSPEVVELSSTDSGLVQEDLDVFANGFGAALDPGAYQIVASAGDCWGSADFAITLGEVTEVRLELTASAVDRAPYLYLYPLEPTATHVRLPDPDRVVLAEPSYPEQGWDLLALPDGTLLLDDGPRSFLYYELVLDRSAFQFERGWCARGHQTQAGIEQAMADWGFLPVEIEDFAEYWDPRFPSRGWQTVYPQGPELYELRIQPPPERLLRVNFVVRSGCHPVEPFLFEPLPRNGYHAAEWGVVLLDGQDGEVESGM